MRSVNLSIHYLFQKKKEKKSCSQVGYLVVVFHLLVGKVQKERAAKILGLHPCGFRPQHSSKLGNEFRLFTNYDPGMRLGGWEK